MILGFLNGCQWDSKLSTRPNLLIIAVSHWSSEELGCSSSKSNSSTPYLDRFCGESIRFTHAYTNSTLVVPSLLSVTTGLNPIDHGIHFNGASLLDKAVPNLFDELAERGYRTSFFGGGLPVIKKTALAEGFQLFVDSITADSALSVSSELVAEEFTHWTESIKVKDNFAALVFFNDLLQEQLQGHTASGQDVLESPRAKMLSRIDRSFNLIERQLKKENLWDNTLVVVLAPVGIANLVDGELSTSDSLYINDESLKVPLLVKMPSKKRDLSPSWKIDLSIDLADLGATLYDFFDLTSGKPARTQVTSFKDYLIQQGHQQNAKKTILTEDFRFFRADSTAIRFFLRSGSRVLVKAGVDKLYDAYSDRYFLHNLAELEPNQKKELEGHLAEMLSGLSLSPTSKENWEDYFLLARKLLKSDFPEIQFKSGVGSFFKESFDDVVRLRLVKQQRLSEALHFEKPKSSKDRLITILIDKTKQGLTRLDCGMVIKLAFENKPLLVLQAFEEHPAQCLDRELGLWLRSWAMFQSESRKEAQEVLNLAKMLSRYRLEIRKLSESTWRLNFEIDGDPNVSDYIAPIDFLAELDTNTSFSNFLNQAKANP